MIASTPTAVPISLRLAMWACTKRSRSSGSSSPTGRSAVMAETRLPSASCSSSERTDTGTMALNTTPSGTSSPRSRR